MAQCRSSRTTRTRSLLARPHSTPARAAASSRVLPRRPVRAQSGSRTPPRDRSSGSRPASRHRASAVAGAALGSGQVRATSWPIEAVSTPAGSVAAMPGGRGQDLAHRPEGQALPVGQAPSPEHVDPVADLGRGRPGQGRLADPGVADQQHQPVVVGGVVQGLDQPRQVVLAADQGFGGRLGGSQAEHLHHLDRLALAAGVEQARRANLDDAAGRPQGPGRQAGSGRARPPAGSGPRYAPPGRPPAGRPTTPRLTPRRCPARCAGAGGRRRGRSRPS